MEGLFRMPASYERGTPVHGDERVMSRKNEKNTWYSQRKGVWAAISYGTDTEYTSPRPRMTCHVQEGGKHLCQFCKKGESTFVNSFSGHVHSMLQGAQSSLGGNVHSTGVPRL